MAKTYIHLLKDGDTGFHELILKRLDQAVLQEKTSARELHEIGEEFGIFNNPYKIHSKIYNEILQRLDQYEVDEEACMEIMWNIRNAQGAEKEHPIKLLIEYNKEKEYYDTGVEPVIVHNESEDDLDEEALDYFLELLTTTPGVLTEKAPVNVKLCVECNTVKDMKDFYKIRKGVHRLCKICHNKNRSSYKRKKVVKPKVKKLRGYDALPLDVQKSISYDIHVKRSFKHISEKHNIKYSSLLLWKNKGSIKPYNEA